MSWWGPWYGATEAVAPTDPVTTAPAPDVLFMTAVNGVLWGQSPTGALVSYDTDMANHVEAFSMRVKTGALRPGANPLGWGRVRSLAIHGRNLRLHAITARLYADATGRIIANKTTVITPTTPSNWPSEGVEFRATQQRCSYVQAELIATPPGAEWTAIDLWVSNTGEGAPSRNRS